MVPFNDRQTTVVAKCIRYDDALIEIIDSHAADYHDTHDTHHGDSKIIDEGEGGEGGYTSNTCIHSSFVVLMSQLMMERMRKKERRVEKGERKFISLSLSLPTAGTAVVQVCYSVTSSPVESPPSHSLSLSLP